MSPLFRVKVGTTSEGVRVDNRHRESYASKLFTRKIGCLNRKLAVCVCHFYPHFGQSWICQSHGLKLHVKLSVIPIEKAILGIYNNIQPKKTMSTHICHSGPWGFVGELCLAHWPRLLRSTTRGRFCEQLGRWSLEGYHSRATPESYPYYVLLQ